MTRIIDLDPFRRDSRAGSQAGLQQALPPQGRGIKGVGFCSVIPEGSGFQVIRRIGMTRIIDLNPFRRDSRAGSQAGPQQQLIRFFAKEAQNDTHCQLDPFPLHFYTGFAVGML